MIFFSKMQKYIKMRRLTNFLIQGLMPRGILLEKHEHPDVGRRCVSVMKILNLRPFFGGTF